MIRRLFPEPETPDWGESFETLLEHGGVRIERIVSAPGTRSGPYDQGHAEWVCLLQGSATLEVEDEILSIRAGDAVFLPAHAVHRVTETSADPPCVWLAVHILGATPARDPSA